MHQVKYPTLPRFTIITLHDKTFSSILMQICYMIVPAWLVAMLCYCIVYRFTPDISLSDTSFLMLSNHLRFGLPFLRLPGTSITITLLPTYSSSLLNTCPYTTSTYVPALSSKFPTSNFFSCDFFTTHVSAP